MIAVDTSALVAIALEEACASACEDAMKSADRLIMSAGTMAEVLIVSGRRGFAAAMLSLLEGFGVEIVPVTRASARRVAEAHVRWGRGGRMPPHSISAIVLLTRLRVPTIARSCSSAVIFRRPISRACFGSSCPFANHLSPLPPP